MNFSMGHLYRPYQDFFLSLVFVSLRTAVFNFTCSESRDSVQLWISYSWPLAKLRGQLAKHRPYGAFHSRGFSRYKTAPLPD